MFASSPLHPSIFCSWFCSSSETIQSHRLTFPPLFTASKPMLTESKTKMIETCFSLDNHYCCRFDIHVARTFLILSPPRCLLVLYLLRCYVKTINTECREHYFGFINKTPLYFKWETQRACMNGSGWTPVKMAKAFNFHRQKKNEWKNAHSTDRDGK